MALDQGESFLSGIKFRSMFVERSSDEFDSSLWEDVNCGSHNQGKSDNVVTDDDIVDQLPLDPFDMDISAKVTAAITGWIEDFGLKNLGFIESCSEGEEEDDQDDYEEVEIEEEADDDRDHDQLLAEVSIVWNTVEHPDLNGGKSYKESDWEKGFYKNDDGNHPLCLDHNIEAFMGFSYEKYWNPRDAAYKRKGWMTVKSKGADVPAGPPPDALFFALGYLDMWDLLSVERVCKSLRDAVRNDPLLWRNFHALYPLCCKITDDALLRLTNRAQGSLYSLNIVGCLKITDSGLQGVLARNPGLTKLSVAGCQGLTIEGTLQNMRFFKSIGKPGIKKLRIGSPFGLTDQHFEQLKCLLGAEKMTQVNEQKLRFFRADQLYLPFDDERVLDIEFCPRCGQLRQVYDCPADSCRVKQHTPQVCKGCTVCITRCINCGRCLINCDFEETFFLDFLCSDCLKQVFHCPDAQKRVAIPPKNAYLHQQASYHFILYG